MFVPSLNAELNHHLLLSSGGAVQIGVFDWLTPPEEILRQSLQNPLALLRERERARERESARERERERVRLKETASNLLTMASNLEAMFSNLEAMASN